MRTPKLARNLAGAHHEAASGLSNRGHSPHPLPLPPCETAKPTECALDSVGYVPFAAESVS